MKQSITLKIDGSAYCALGHPIDIFLDAWIWEACGDMVPFTQESDAATHTEVITITVDSPEAAVFLKLQGIPKSLKEFVKIVK